jgi:hypothetical protein
MAKIGTGVVLAVILLATGCEGMFATLVRLNVEGSMPKPIVRLEHKLTVSEFRVQRFTGLKEKEVQRIEYWGVAATTTKQERSLAEIRYGNVVGRKNSIRDPDDQRNASIAPREPRKST